MNLQACCSREHEVRLRIPGADPPFTGRDVAEHLVCLVGADLSGFIAKDRLAPNPSMKSLSLFAQIPPSLRDGLQAGLGIIFLFGFIWGVVKIWNGADKMSKGDADGKMGIISGIIIAAAAAIMAALFTIFGMGDGVLTPTFN